MGDDALVEELLALLDNSLGEGVAEGKPTVVADVCHSGYLLLAKGNDVSRLVLELIVDSQIEQLFA